MAFRKRESRKTLQTMKDSSIQSFSPNAFDDDYELTTEVIEKGKKSITFLGLCKNSGERVSVRKISTDKMSAATYRRIINEFKVLRSLKHNHIVAVRDIYDMEEEIWVVSEYIHGSTLGEQVLNENFTFSENDAAYVLKAMCKALSYCTQKNVVHRNLIPENIIFSNVNGKKRLKIVGFQWSKQLDSDSDSLETLCGTLHFTAPEVLMKNRYNFKCDVWSLGVILYLMLSGGYLPFSVADNESYSKLFEKIKSGKLQFSPSVAWDNVSFDAKDLVKRMLKKNPADRPTYEEILNHKFFKTQAAQSFDSESEDAAIPNILRATGVTVLSSLETETADKGL